MKDKDSSTTGKSTYTHKTDSGLYVLLLTEEVLKALEIPAGCERLILRTDNTRKCVLQHNA